MLFSVVLPAHNAEEFIGAQLLALRAQVGAGPFEVIVVDNLSTDRTAAIAAQHADALELRIVTATEGRSASYARNVGIGAARGEFVVFVDADDVADPSLLAAYRRVAPRYMIMGGSYEERLLNDSRIASWRPELTKNGLPIAYRRVQYFLMGNAAVHRSVFDDIGKFDEALTHGGEEVDFSLRARLAAYEIGWVPDAIVHYRHRDSLRGLARQFYDYGRATTYVYARHRAAARLSRTTVADAGRVLWDVVPHAVDVVRGNARRGRWVLESSFYAGEVLESVRQRTWYVGG
jgi:glycosyltransferase involved in cell wall biosynthesis